MSTDDRPLFTTESESDPAHDAGDVDLNATIKTLLRDGFWSLLNAAGVDIKDLTGRFEDPTITRVPEYRADHVLMITDSADGKETAVMLEYAVNIPDRKTRRRWMWKVAALEEQLDCEVVLLAVYLKQGDRRTFPTEFVTRLGPLETWFGFSALRFWELAPLILAGKYPELAPALVLCYDEPRIEILDAVRRIILSQPWSNQIKSNMIATSIALATRYFPRDDVHKVFLTEEDMLKDYPPVQEWLQAAFKEGEARGEARGLERGEALGLERGLLLGKLELMRDLLTANARPRLGAPEQRHLVELSRIEDLALLTWWSQQLESAESWDELLALRPG